MQISSIKTRENALIFGAYKSSKYRYAYSSNNILDSFSVSKDEKKEKEDSIFLSSLNLSEDEYPIAKEMVASGVFARNHLKRYKNGRTGQNRMFIRFVKAKIKELFRFFTPNKTLDSEAKTIACKLKNGDVEASNFEMLLDLVADKKLSPTVLLYSCEKSKISKNAESDLDKLYFAYANNLPARDVFVPEFKTPMDAKHLEVGDVCQFDWNKNISIKRPDNTFMELFISKDTFLELFPPVERYAFNQSRQGNCYFVAAIDSIYQNKNTRHKILEMFRENEDGSVDVKYNGFRRDEDGKILPNGANFILKNIEKEVSDAKLNYSAFTCEGLRALEILNGKNSEYEGRKNIDARYRLFKRLEAQMGDGDDIFYNDFKYTKDEIKSFIFLYENSKDDIISSKDKDLLALCVEKEDVEYALHMLDKEKEDSFNSKYERLILERYLEFLTRTKERFVVFEEYLPYDLYANITGSSIDPECPLIYNQSGSPETIFHKMGFETFIGEIDSKEVYEILHAKDSNDRFLFACTSHSAPKNYFNIISNHTYSITPKTTENGTLFAVRNPKNTVNEILLSYEELLKYFDLVSVANIT